MDKVAENCAGCVFDLNYCLDSFGNEVTEDMRNCGFSRKNRNSNPDWLERYGKDESCV
jgi:hypothetical protein